MTKRFISAISVILAVMLVLGSLTLSASAAGGISYSFEGGNAGDRGFAQGTIRVSADSSSGGSYTLYWADDSAALSGFDPICTLNVAASSSASFNMPAYTVIPAQATKVIGFRGSVPSGMSVSSAAAVYDIPESKRLSRSKSDMLYSFASYSDTHISCNDSTAASKYPYDEQKLADAFNAAADRGVDFIITTGDNVNNERDDSKGGSNPFYAEEWNTYLNILADSNYVNPIYEAIGNHELWCYDHDNADLIKGMDWKTGSDYFCTVTGLDSTDAALASGKAYYEVTEPTTGDHFLFMALEGGFYTNMNDEFSDEQLSWLDSKLTQYEKDGKNIFIMQHCNIKYWGAGDQLDKPIYDLGLESGYQSTAKLKALLQKHKSAVMITGHTHFKLDLQLNYSTNNQTSATVMHNSSVGGVRNILNRTTRVNDTSRELSEGYFVEVYDNATIFYGANLYYNKINPSTSYIIPQTTSSTEPKPTQPTQPTQATQATQTTQPTQATQAPTQAPTQKPALTDGFYLIRPHWDVSDIDTLEKFEVNQYNTSEYKLKTTLAQGDRVKVVKVSGGKITKWYPDGTDNEYFTDSAHAGTVNIYFKESYQSDWKAFGGYFYIESKGPATEPTQPPTQAPTQPPTQATQPPTQAPTQPPTQATQPPTQATQPPTQEPTTSPKAGYYLVGTMSDWQMMDKYKLSKNTAADTEEYYINDIDLKTTSGFKIVYSEAGKSFDIWYPEGVGVNYGASGEIQTDGRYDIYFRPQADGGEGWFKGYIYADPTVPATEEPTQPVTQAPTQPATQAPTQAPEPEIIYGDADGDEIVTIMDVTVIQRWLLGTWELDDDAITRATVSGEDELSIVDATLIQRRLLDIIDFFPVESVTPIYEEPEPKMITRDKDSEIADTGADLNTLRSQAKAALDKYRLLASYDQYQALKKAYRLNYGYDQLSSAYNTFTGVAAKHCPSDYITVYFTNNVGWAENTVKAYCTAGHGKDKNAAWPGVVMEKEKSNKYGEPVYSITVPRGKYNFIIFTNGAEQTADLALGVTDNQGYYYNSSLGKGNSNQYRCSSYKYDPATS